MSYLLIRNRGLAPIEAFTILGLSTARGEADKIGQFGSGSKHGILALMRAGVSFAIFIGEDQLLFYAQEAEMNGVPYKEVRYRWKGEDHKTGMCLEFGALDWDTVKMSLREFICNALDQGEAIADCAAATESMGTVVDETRIYVSMSHPEVAEYWRDIRDYFLHFGNQEAVEILPARGLAAQFFRRGVFVTQTGGDSTPALFLYNFQTGKIDESRNLDGASVSKIAARLLLASRERLSEVFASFVYGPKWEHSIGGAVYGSSHTVPNGVQNVREAWRAAYGDAPFLSDPSAREALERKAIRYALIPHIWTSALIEAGIVDAKTLLNGIDVRRGQVCDATPSAIQTFRLAWSWLESVHLTQGKPFPKVGCFSMPMDAGIETHGYYHDGTVFLNLDFDTNEQTALEELAHYITGANDETRDFQDFAFKLATRLAKRFTPSLP